MAIIHHIDVNGYLRETLETIASQANCGVEDAGRVLKLIQTFDPPGVAGRDLKECLLIQLERSGSRDALLETLITHHLESLTSADSLKLSKKLKCTPQELSCSIRKIQHLEPKPGRRFFDEEIAYVIPDISVEEKDDHLTVVIRDDVLPVLRVSPQYKAMLKSKKVAEETKDFIRQRMLSATNLIRAIRQRKETLSRVVSMIAEVQSEALHEGMERLKPLVFKEISERLNLHESTISRVVMNKYIQTPHGIFALKEFFSNGLKSEEGDDVSSQRIKLKIRELVDSEDKVHPLRDQKIAEFIQESEKIQLARRTVVKYREFLNIPSVAKRRSKNALISAQ